MTEPTSSLDQATQAFNAWRSDKSNSKRIPEHFRTQMLRT